MMTGGGATAEELRLALVRKLRRDGTLHPGRMERAFARVPRHLFLPEVDLDYVYRDTSIPTKLQAGEIISSSSQPAIMAIMLEQLAPRPGQRVLEVGAGTGYNAALLAEVVGEHGQVTAVDLDADTVHRARSALSSTGYARVRVEQTDGMAGFDECAPYDRIIATVGMGDIPLAWWSQLKRGGRLVLPLSMRGVMRAVGFRKDAAGRLVGTSIKPAGFMPFRGAHPLVQREVRVGPELGLYAWFAAEGSYADTAQLYALLGAGFDDVATNVKLTRADYWSGLNLWIRGHQPDVFTLHADGALADSGPVASFLRHQWAILGARDRLSLGLYADGEAALLGTPGDVTGEREAFQLVVRAFGGTRLAQRLTECTQAWRRAGSPTDEQLRLRLVPHGRRSRAPATIPLQAGTLELTWRKA
jgi:protein-L-isoaspartate(D-aspartate) O-methyltransferase